MYFGLNLRRDEMIVAALKIISYHSSTEQR
jgi:hypothetical protein